MDTREMQNKSNSKKSAKHIGKYNNEAAATTSERIKIVWKLAGKEKWARAADKNGFH